MVLRDPLPWPELRQVVETAEDTGYAAVFVPEITAREAFVTLARFALATDRLGLGTGVVTLDARSAGTTAMAAASLQDLSGGRAILGIGAGSSGSLDAVRRYVGDVRSSIGELELADEARTVPIWLGALGDGMVSLAGEVADGVLLNWCTPERVARATALVREAAERAGRDPSHVTIGVYVRACLGIDAPSHGARGSAGNSRRQCPLWRYPKPGWRRSGKDANAISPGLGWSSRDRQAMDQLDCA